MSWRRVDQGACLCGDPAEFEHVTFGHRLCQPETYLCSMESLGYTTAKTLVERRCGNHAPRAVEILGKVER